MLHLLAKHAGTTVAIALVVTTLGIGVVLFAG